jgi:hypothetical protein
MDDMWDTVIYPGMKAAVTNALLCCQDVVEQRKVMRFVFVTFIIQASMWSAKRYKGNVFNPSVNGKVLGQLTLPGLHPLLILINSNSAILGLRH